LSNVFGLFEIFLPQNCVDKVAEISKVHWFLILLEFKLHPEQGLQVKDGVG